MDFHGQSAFITGASVGIGRAVALLLAQRGAQVSLCDINYEKLELVKKEIEEYTKDVLIFKCDVSDEECVNTCIKKTEEAFGKVDILVNNAALWRFWSPFVETPTDEWKKLLDVNIMGTVYPTKAALPGMLERKYGRIINVASIAGVIGNANMVHYSATKGAVISMTQALAKEVSVNGITVNSVAPGSVSNSSDEDIDAWQPSELSFVGRTGTDRENAELREQVKQLDKSIEQYRAMEETLQKSIVLAQTAAEDIKKTAAEKADVIVNEAQTKSESMYRQLDGEIQAKRNELASVQAEVTGYKSRIKGICSGLLEMLDKLE